jgi:hypothetical protein
MTEIEFHANEEAILLDGGAEVRVTILENLCNNLRKSYRVRVIQSLVPHPIMGALRSGHEITLSKTRGEFEVFVGWELRPYYPN